ncbi:unnamed protein product, partial [Rotaria magnacalcarata]
TSTTPSTISILATGSPLTVTSGGSTLASGSPTTLPSDEILTSVYQDKATPNLLRHASATKKMTVQKIARGYKMIIF